GSLQGARQIGGAGSRGSRALSRRCTNACDTSSWAQSRWCRHRHPALRKSELPSPSRQAQKHHRRLLSRSILGKTLCPRRVRYIFTSPRLSSISPLRVSSCVVAVALISFFGSESAVWPRYCFSSRSLLSHRVRLLPEPAGNLDRVNAGLLPPRALVACAVQFPMVPAAEGDREFVARFAAQRAWLHVAQMVGIGWLAATDEARLLHDIAKVLAAAIAPRGGNGEDALVNALRLTSVDVFGGDG